MQSVLTFVTGYTPNRRCTQGCQILNQRGRDCVTLPHSREVTQLLRAWSEGEPGALEKLTPVVYDELHRLAEHYMAHERADRPHPAG
jgi:hypothetical protein